MSRVRIYKPAKIATQSGVEHTKEWRLEFEPTSSSYIEPLMGWRGGEDTRQQVHLNFETREKAMAFAQSQGWEVDIEETACEDEPTFQKPKAYEDNYRANRKLPWTH